MALYSFLRNLTISLSWLTTVSSKSFFFTSLMRVSDWYVSRMRGPMNLTWKPSMTRRSLMKWPSSRFSPAVRALPSAARSAECAPSQAPFAAAWLIPWIISYTVAMLLFLIRSPPGFPFFFSSFDPLYIALVASFKLIHIQIVLGTKRIFTTNRTSPIMVSSK